MSVRAHSHTQISCPGTAPFLKMGTVGIQGQRSVPVSVQSELSANNNCSHRWIWRISPRRGPRIHIRHRVCEQARKFAKWIFYVSFKEALPVHAHKISPCTTHFNLTLMDFVLYSVQLKVYQKSC